MLFERVYEDGLAHASFMIACQQKNTALVVDPRRDVSVYLDLAAKHGLTIEAVTETHIHADYLSGSRELAEATGATLYVSGEGGEDWQYGFEAERLRSGDTITLGNITVEAVHTPGHTPEHLTFLITDGAVADEPGYMLTGDFVFVGDVGRPDLLDEAAGGEDTRFAGAKDLFRSLKNTFLTMPDYVQVFPAHGAGSPCGKSLGAVPSTTVGYERATAWWAPFVENDDEQGFIDSLLEGQPDAPTYFSRMKRLNKEGPALLGERHRPEELGSDAVDGLVRDEEAIVVDPRDQHAVHSGTYPGSLNIPAGANASKFAAWTIDPDTEHRRLIIATDDAELARDCS
ncbi:MAG TPA: MBL fold metallo-hydrolase, partial [Dietzia timorensis]